jgi:hypothetical protein
MRKIPTDLLVRVAERAESLYEDFGILENRTTIVMDLMNADTSLAPEGLNFENLATCDHETFGHDMLGIRQHMNRETGQLEGCFLPRTCG